MADLRHLGEAHESERGQPARSARTSGFCRPRQPCTARTWWIVIEPALPRHGNGARGFALDSPLEGDGTIGPPVKDQLVETVLFDFPVRFARDSPLEEGGFELSRSLATVSSGGALWRSVASREIGTPERARAGGSDLSGKIADENGIP
jgi:hypothetical protein